MNAPNSLSAPRPPTKDALLKQADSLRDLARRSRRLAAALPGDSDRRRLARHADELDESASRFEHEAAGARAS